jgi:hypothetical protein
MKTPFIKLSLLALAAGAVGCSFAMRDANTYRDDTHTLLQSKQGQITQCYDQVLQTNPGAGGTVTVRFVVQEDTGQIVEPAVVPEQSTAPPELGQCVVTAIDGLVLAPADENPGHAMFSYEFNPGAAPSAPAPAAQPPGGPPALKSAPPPPT